MRKIYLFLFVVSLALSLCGCVSLFGSKRNANEKKLQAAATQVSNVKDDLNKNDKEKIYVASTMAVGTDRALTKVTNTAVDIKVAKEMNDRVISILGSPHLDDQNKIKKIVDQLTSEIQAERNKGEKALAEKDAEIIDIQNSRDELRVQMKVKTEEYNQLAVSVAAKADNYKETVDKCNSWFGLGAVFYGVKRLFTTCLVFIIISGIVFILIRVLAASNPMIGAAYGIFNSAGSILLHVFKGILPGSFHSIGMVWKSDRDKYKNVLIKLVDVTEEMKSHDNIIPTDKSYTFKDYLVKIDQELGDADKAVCNEIKTDLRWKS